MRRRSLRLRLALTFGFGAFILSALFATVTFVGVHHVLVSDAVQTDLNQSYVNAALVRSTLYTSPPDLANELNSIEGATGSSVLVQTHREWLSKSNGAATADVPVTLIDEVVAGHAATQVIGVGNHVFYVVGVPIPSVETQFFEVFPLDPVAHTLSILLLVLVLGAAVTSLTGLAGGLWVARRTVRPLEDVSRAAAAIAGGDLSTRLLVNRADREVQQLTASFNEMVARLTDRLERDARFASDVSHELRSPLTTLVTTARVLRQHRELLSDVGRQSLDLLVADLSIFQALVEDLLEIARSDAGAAPLVLETVDAAELVRQSVRSAARRHGFAEPPVEIDPGLDHPLVEVDRRRFERALTNLLDNAHHYAGGATAVRVEGEGDHLAVHVDDAGPGVLDEEREAVFERFSRGHAARNRGVARGTGLGLALVREHVRTLHGTVEVTRAPEGGARFSVRLPLASEASS